MCSFYLVFQHSSEVRLGDFETTCCKTGLDQKVSEKNHKCTMMQIHKHSLAEMTDVFTEENDADSHKHTENVIQFMTLWGALDTVLVMHPLLYEHNVQFFVNPGSEVCDQFPVVLHSLLVLFKDFLEILTKTFPYGFTPYVKTLDRNLTPRDLQSQHIQHSSASMS